MLNYLLKRETGSSSVRATLQNLVEESYVKGEKLQFDNKLPMNVSSTIAIAISSDGRTLATTHGDHTVKIFMFSSGKPVRVFHGHPRTPWSVKFHPIDSNIVASGCLGFEVRIWDIENDVCINITKLDFSIISLAFHPGGQYIAIASGGRMEIWDWKKEANLKNRGKIISRNSFGRSVTHMRNIRAVMFHPKGDYIFAAAPDSPKPSSEANTHCKLFSFKFSLLTDMSAITPYELSSMPFILPQIHLYSDGGLDISSNGEYLLTCAHLYQLRTGHHPTCKYYNHSLSPLSHTERIRSDDNPNNVPMLFSRPHNPQPPSALQLSPIPPPSWHHTGDSDPTSNSSFTNGLRSFFGTSLMSGSLLGTPPPPHHSQSQNRLNEEVATHFNSSGDMTQQTPPSSQQARSLLQAMRTSRSTSSAQQSTFYPQQDALNSNGEIPHHRVMASEAAAGAMAHNRMSQLRRNVGVEGLAELQSLYHQLHSHSPMQPGHEETQVEREYIRAVLNRYRTNESNPGGNIGHQDSEYRLFPEHSLPMPPMHGFGGSDDGANSHTPPVPPPIIHGRPPAHVQRSTSGPGGYHGFLTEHEQRMIFGSPSPQDSSIHPLQAPAMQVPFRHRFHGTSGSDRRLRSTDDINIESYLARERNNAPHFGFRHPDRRLNLQQGQAPHSAHGFGSPHQYFHPHMPLPPTMQHVHSTFGTPVKKTMNTGFSPLLHEGVYSLYPPLASPATYVVEDHLCLFRLHMNNGELVSISIENSMHLPGDLMRAVTSTKLSSTVNHALIGYGVRNEGDVEDHPIEKHTACEILNLSNMRSQCIMTDEEDEVNIAQFHFLSGQGVVYGTKKGKIRCFVRDA